MKHDVLILTKARGVCVGTSFAKKVLVAIATLLGFAFSALGIGVFWGVISFDIGSLTAVIDIDIRKIVARLCLLGMACWSAYTFFVMCGGRFRKGKGKDSGKDSGWRARTRAKLKNGGQ